MSDASAAFRQHLVRALDWDEAHVRFAAATAGLPPSARGMRPAGFEHTPWALVEHLRIALQDLLDFCVDAHYAHQLTWPDDYWPREDGPASEQAWEESLAAYARAIDGLARVARETDDLTVRVPTGTSAQTYLRTLLLAIDHNAYHVGQLVAVRRALGQWKR